MECKGIEKGWCSTYVFTMPTAVFAASGRTLNSRICAVEALRKPPNVQGLAKRWADGDSALSNPSTTNNHVGPFQNPKSEKPTANPNPRVSSIDPDFWVDSRHTFFGPFGLSIRFLVLVAEYIFGPFGLSTRISGVGRGILFQTSRAFQGCFADYFFSIPEPRNE